jgi:hypothetical protein
MKGLSTGIQHSYLGNLVSNDYTLIIPLVTILNSSRLENY